MTHGQVAALPVQPRAFPKQVVQTISREERSRSTLEERKDGSTCHSKKNYGRTVQGPCHVTRYLKRKQERRLKAGRRRRIWKVWREGYGRASRTVCRKDLYGKGKGKDERKESGHPPEPTDTCGRCPGRHLRITLVAPCVKYQPWSACGDIMLTKRTRAHNASDHTPSDTSKGAHAGRVGRRTTAELFRDRATSHDT